MALGRRRQAEAGRQEDHRGLMATAAPEPGTIVHYVPHPTHGDSSHWNAMVTFVMDCAVEGCHSCVHVIITDPPQGECNVAVPHDATGLHWHSWHPTDQCPVEVPRTES